MHDDPFDPKEFPVRSTVLRSPAVIREVNDAIRRLTLERDLLLADYHTALVDTRGLMRPDASDDGLHPNERGFALMQAAVAPVVRLALSRTTTR